MNSVGVISGVSVSHRNASVDDIEAATDADESTVVRDLLARDGVSEAFALQTCNRAEAYVVTDDVADGRRALTAFSPDVREGAVVTMDHEESLRHLMRVAAGLESLILGEDQILGQFRSAVETAREVGGVGELLDDALTKAIHVGERARTETRINEGVVSLGSAAVELADERLELSEATALVVGAGEMGRVTANALAAASVDRLVVANRTRSRADHLIDEIAADGRAVGLDRAPDAAVAADLVVAATGSPTHVLDADDLAGAGDTFVIDIAQPRDVDPAAGLNDRVVLKDIDDLESVTEATKEARRSAATAVERMIDAEFERLIESFKRNRADEAISAMYEGAERVKARELDRALEKLEAQGDLTDEQRETVEALADALVGQLLASPTSSLREAAAEDDWTTIQTAMRLFDPGFADAPEGPISDRPDAKPDGVDEAEIPERVLDQLSDD